MRRAILFFLVLTGCLTLTSHAQVCGLCHDIHGTDRGRVHAEGVASCNICHTMHNSQDGVPVDPDNPGGNPWLLIDDSPSDVCLMCHADWISNTLGGDPLNPPYEVGAGNFAFLLEDNLNDGHGGSLDPISGDAAGHNIVAPAYGVSDDGTVSAAPGGDFPSAVLGCTSCHDPHGNTNFRMLYGAGRSVQDGLYVFTHAAPVAEGISIYHGRETNTKHSAYKSGVSAWCGNCHADFHNNSTALIHPSGSPIGPTLASSYNLYNGTEDMTGGSGTTAYLAAVPFEDPASTIYSAAGPAATSQVMCLTCHRAHASSAPDAGRWDFNVTFLHEDGVESGSHAIPDPYDSLNQRSLCNKCHTKDEFDAIQ